MYVGQGNVALFDLWNLLHYSCLGVPKGGGSSEECMVPVSYLYDPDTDAAPTTGAEARLHGDTAFGSPGLASEGILAPTTRQPFLPLLPCRVDQRALPHLRVDKWASRSRCGHSLDLCLRLRAHSVGHWP